jgi:hypothetical protein
MTILPPRARLNSSEMSKTSKSSIEKSRLLNGFEYFKLRMMLLTQAMDSKYLLQSRIDLATC